jgi:hypothetical protein
MDNEVGHMAYLFTFKKDIGSKRDSLVLFSQAVQGIVNYHRKDRSVNLPQDKPGGFSPFETAPQQRSLTISR